MTSASVRGLLGLCLPVFDATRLLSDDPTFRLPDSHSQQRNPRQRMGENLKKILFFFSRTKEVK
jgi:hypothetical protein